VIDPGAAAISLRTAPVGKDAGRLYLNPGRLSVAAPYPDLEMLKVDDLDPDGRVPAHPKIIRQESRQSPITNEAENSNHPGRELVGPISRRQTVPAKAARSGPAGSARGDRNRAGRGLGQFPRHDKKRRRPQLFSRNLRRVRHIMRYRASSHSMRLDDRRGVGAIPPSARQRIKEFARPCLKKLTFILYRRKSRADEQGHKRLAVVSTISFPEALSTIVSFPFVRVTSSTRVKPSGTFA